MRRTVVKPAAPAPPLPGQSTGIYPIPNFRVIEPIVIATETIITTVLWREGDDPYDQDVPEPDFPLRLAIFQPEPES